LNVKDNAYAAAYTQLFVLAPGMMDNVKYGAEQERSRPEWSGITPE